MPSNASSSIVERDSILISRPRPYVLLLRNCAAPLGVLRVSVKHAMLEALERADHDDEIRAVVITGNDRAFSVGSDVREFEQSAEWLERAEAAENALNNCIENMRIPVIAAINGHALGGGLVLALACDIRIAARSAVLGVPEVKVGAFASGSGTQRLPALIGKGRALHLLLTGEIIDGAEALRIGLVEQVSEDDRLLEDALDLAGTIASMPPDAVSASKRCVNIGMREGWAAGMACEAEVLVPVGLSADAIEGQKAFMEKRAPRFGK